MAGVKGRSGGPRANSGGPRPNSGGARPGAGRKPKERATPDAKETPLAFLLGVMNDPAQDPVLRVRAAGLAAQYVHPKRGEGGKSEAKNAAAKEAGAGKFAPAAPPKLVVNNSG